MKSLHLRGRYELDDREAEAWLRRWRLLERLPQATGVILYEEHPMHWAVALCAEDGVLLNLVPKAQMDRCSMLGPVAVLAGATEVDRPTKWNANWKGGAR